MNFKTLTGAVLITTFSLLNPAIVFSQPSSSGSYRSGYWQPTATLDNTNAMKVILSNQSGVSVNYDSPIGPRMGATLSAGDSTTIVVPPIESPMDIVNISIYSPTGELLVFDYSVAGTDTVTVRIRRSGLVSGQVSETNVNSEFDGSVYIDERGRIYSF